MKTIVKCILAAATVLPVAAFAHVGAGDAHDHAGLLAGLLHPLSGVDHLAAMLAVGIWSALAMRPAWLAPLAFVALLTVGALAGFADLAVPAVEPMIAASLLVLGLLVATRRGLQVAVAAGLVGAFAFCHGAAHGRELAAGAQWQALAGMVCTTALLHLAGMAIGRALAQRQRWLTVASGSAVAGLGMLMLTRLA